MPEELIVTRCSDCGGEIIFGAGKTVARCSYCGAPNQMPRKPEIKKNLDYANELRNSGEFREAMRAYQDVLQLSPDEVEARWGRLLAKYGVIYVEDKEKRECHITCRRSVKTLFQEEHDYEAILNLAEPEVREKYINDAKYIDRVQMKIRILRQQEKPYDVFLCYKERDGSGGRTEDSLRMQGIYNDLTKDGYRVFFAPETLKDKTGADYESAIFAAIESSRVMLVMGTRKEYFTSTWVRSEWRRYLEKMDNREDKVLLPLFEDAKDLPEEFTLRFIQGYKMEGPYLLDLKSRLLKLLRTEDSRFELAKALLQLKQFSEADDLLKGMQIEAPWNARIWLYRAMAAEKIWNEEAFLSVTHSLNDNSYFLGAMAYASETEKEKLREYLDASEKNAREAMKKQKEGQKEDLPSPVHAAEDIPAQRTGMDWERGLIALEDGEYDKAEEIFTKMTEADPTDALGWLGKLMAEKNVCREEDLALSAGSLVGSRNYQRAVRYGDEALRTRLAGYETAVQQRRSLAYQAAVTLQQAGKYGEAIAAFEGLGNYRDCKAKIKECRAGEEYQAAVALQQAGRYEEAIAAFAALGDHPNAAAQITETRYLKAKELLQKKDHIAAAAILRELEGYKDADSMLANISAAVRNAKYAVGKRVTFGSYPQTKAGNDNTPIEWIVLARNGQKALLLSRYGLDAQPYNTSQASVTWETCTLRAWLNGEFMDKAFSAKEQGTILLTTVDNGIRQGYAKWNTSGGNNTEDRIFLLSCAEAYRYLGVIMENNNNMRSRVSPTAYAVQAGAIAFDKYKASDGRAAGWWWLRSPGYIQLTAAGVLAGGSLLNNYVEHTSACVRPALWVDLASEGHTATREGECRNAAALQQAEKRKEVIPSPGPAEKKKAAREPAADQHPAGKKPAEAPKAIKPEEAMARGREYEKKEDYVHALEQYRIAAEQGDADGQYKTGECYYYGRGELKNEVAALNWFRKAAVQGHIESQYWLAEYCRHWGGANNEAEAAMWYRKAAEQGHTQSQYWLGECFRNGWGVVKNDDVAMNWYRKAEAGGHDCSKEIKMIEVQKERIIAEQRKKEGLCEFCGGDFNRFKRCKLCGKKKSY